MSPFDHDDPDDIADLIQEHPLAWLIAPGAGVETASVLPLLADRGPDGRIVRLVGHMARRNPLQAALSREPRALILFQGPQAYVSPALSPSRDWAPTWNYVQVRIEAEIRFRPEAGRQALERLVAALETGRPAPWSLAELGERLHRLEPAIVAFEAEVLHLSATFKLGQDEQRETLDAILAGHDNLALTRWMRRLNRRQG